MPGEALLDAFRVITDFLQKRFTILEVLFTCKPHLLCLVRLWRVFDDVDGSSWVLTTVSRLLLRGLWILLMLDELTESRPILHTHYVVALLRLVAPG